MAAGHIPSLTGCSSWHHRLLQASTASFPVGDRDFQWVFSGLWSCKTALTESPSGTVPEDTNCTLLFYGSPAWAHQTPCSQFHSNHWGQAWHIPLQPLTFPLSLNCSIFQETRSSCPQVQLKQLNLFQAQAGGKAPAPGDEVGRGCQAWEQPVSYGKGAIQGWEMSLTPASAMHFGPPSLEAADLGWEILRDVGRGAGMEVARQL